MLEIQINCKPAFQIHMTLYSVLPGDVILPCLALSCWYMCSCMNGKCLICHLQKTTNAIHSKYLILHPQQIFNSSAVYIKHTDHLTTSKKANISRICLDIAFDFSRRLADTENKNLSSITASTQNIRIMDIINEEHRY